MLNKVIRYFLYNKIVTTLIIIFIVLWGLVTAPFDWDMNLLPSDPVSVDAIPNIGENQQIIFTHWKGRSPQDIEDQVTYPLTSILLGIPGVKSIRSSSMFGVSSIYIIFNEDIAFYWSRSRILEKINALPPDLLPQGIQPVLGPDATALGQVFWYTLEGRDSEGKPTGGWDLQDLRKQQDFYVKYALSGVKGVSEVASIGGYVQEYQVDIDPDALRLYDISINKVVAAIRASNRDVGAKTMEINKVEYLIRGLGYIKSVKDLEKSVLAVQNHVPITISDVAKVSMGPSTRRGVLDKDGSEVVGGVVVARYGANPMQVIQAVKNKIKDISVGFPSKVLADGTKSQLTLVPFYDRTQLILQTLGTLEEALSLEILITILVVIVMVYNLRASLIISCLLPIAILMVFIAMRYFGVSANIVALSGIAIAIGTMVDLGIILSENIINHLQSSPPRQKMIETIYKASTEVSSAIVTAVATTIVSFIPVFTMQAAEGKLFRPLAFTKTFALIAALIVALMVLPSVAYLFFGIRKTSKLKTKWMMLLLTTIGVWATIWISAWAGLTLIGFGGAWFIKNYSHRQHWIIDRLPIIISLFSINWLLTTYWMPLGIGKSLGVNILFVSSLLTIILGAFLLLESYYSKVLWWCLQHKRRFLSLPIIIILFGMIIWLGFNRLFGFVARGFDLVGIEIRTTKVWSACSDTFPGMGKEFMPALDEGSFLFMPTSMSHAGVAQNTQVLQQLDKFITHIPEVDLSVGKMGRADTALDPAPISMYEIIINYKNEYISDKDGKPLRYKVDNQGNYLLISGDTISHKRALEEGIRSYQLIRDDDGIYFRNWRDTIHSTDDIWKEIVKVTKIPGVTSAPKLQPIQTRLVMLQTGMRAPMGIKVYGSDLQTIQNFGIVLEDILKQVPSVKKEAVFADRIVGKPYIHLNIDRETIAVYGLSIEEVQQTIETAIGGRTVTTAVDGRERYPVRVRYLREWRDNPEALKRIYVSTSEGIQVPLGELVSVEYVRGPQMIKSEDTFLVGYVLFDKREGYAEVDVVQDAQRFINQKIDKGELIIPKGVSYRFSGSYENQVRAQRRLSLIVPIVLVIIFLILYFQFHAVSTSLMIFMGITMAFSGGFLMLWCYGQDWFMDFSLFGTSMRTLFQIHPINLSVAVWVGFIALFGIATDDGVLIGTYLDQSFRKHKPTTIRQVRESVVYAGQKRIKPAIMTTATTIIALLPVLTSNGRGADIMIPMAIPAFGGMLVASISYFIMPVLYSLREENKLKNTKQ